jgi:DNA-binding NarL/FixJ family response regulator
MEKLTARECDVLDLMKHGYDNNEIANIVFISKHTVKAHVTSIIRKFNAKNRTNVIYLAKKNGLID